MNLVQLHLAMPAKWVFTVIILTLVGCTRQGREMDYAELIDFGNRYAEAWSSQDPSSVASFYAENGLLQINDGERSIGREAITEVAQSFMTALPDMVVLMDSVRVQEGNTSFHWTLIGTNSGPEGNGNKINISGFEEWTLDSDGLIAQSLGHMDTAEYERQLQFGRAD